MKLVWTDFPFSLLLVASLASITSSSKTEDLIVGLPLEYKKKLSEKSAWDLLRADGKDSFIPRLPSSNRKKWPALDLTQSDKPYYLKQFQLRGVGEHIEVWVAEDLSFPEDTSNNCRNDLSTNDITDEQVQNCIDEFDSNIYPKLSEEFSVPVDVRMM
jgi:hypothetical protein